MLNQYEINRTLQFNYNLAYRNSVISDVADNIFEELQIKKSRKVESKKKCLNNVLSNLKYAEKGRYYVPVSRKPVYYTQIPKRYRKEFQTYDIMTSVVDGLEDLGLIESELGFRDFSKKKGKLTKIKPTNKFKELTEGFEINTITQEEPRELIVLKKRIDNTFMNYLDNSKVRALRDQLKEFNSLRQNSILSLKGLSKNEIQDYNEFLMFNSTNAIATNQEIMLKNPFVYRVYNGSFKMGGRFYNGIESNMPKTLRKKILIDGKETVELDYNSFHIRILYHQIGKDLKEDAYSCLSGDCKEMRQVYKLVALCSINALSKSKAVQAIRKQIVDNGLKSTVGEINDKKIFSLLEEWETFHSDIKKFFYADTGIKLQNLDSKIASGIIQKFKDAGEVLLCIHDSFIVKKSLEEQLRDTMITEYKKHLDFNPIIS